MSIKSKKILLYSLYCMICLTFIVGISVVKNATLSKEEKTSQNNDIEEKVNGGSNNTIVTVFDEKSVFERPYNDSEVIIGLNFYNSKDEKNNQEDSLIYYENTYIPSTGVFYKKEKEFDVTSIYDGKVKEITKNDLLGNIIKVDYGNNLVGMYQCVDNIKVNVGDNVVNGSVLGTSSTCNIFKDIGNGIYLEIIYKGRNLNPEYYYGKTIGEIE